MSEQAKRLRLARSAKYESATAAAAAMGVPEPTYMGHENGSRGFKLKSAERYARFFRVDLNWLLTGKGSMIGSPIIQLYLELSPDQQGQVLNYMKFLKDQNVSK